MRIRSNQWLSNWPARLVRRLYQGATLVHAASTGLVRRAGRAMARWLRPFPWSTRLAVTAVALGVPLILLRRLTPEGAVSLLDLTGEHLAILRRSGIVDEFTNFGVLAAAVGWFLFAAAFLAFARRRIVLVPLKIAAAAAVVLWGWFFSYIARIPSLLYHADAELFGKFERNDFWLRWTAWWLPLFLLALTFLFCLVLERTIAFYGRTRGRREYAGDRMLRRLSPATGDGRFKSSYYWSAFLHLAVLFLVPVLMRGCGEAAYLIPGGDGAPEVQVVQVKKVKKEKDKVVLNMNSAISFYRPELDDIKVLEDVDDETLNTYQASVIMGKPGKGKGRGGWPGGMEDVKVRFIRLEYAGGDWDQQMGKGADYNFLLQFKKLTGFNIADATEHIPIRQLRRFPEHRAPPFVFITGSGNIQVSGADIKTLRWYCIEEGGMIFADNGGGSFNRSFRSLMRRAFPELEWVDIASDDIIFRQPFLFPSGALPLWHHSGYRALGLKHNGRWIVFYHQGDLNDAWQTGHSGVSEHTAAQAYKIGVNVVNYAFNRYWELHYQ